MDGVQLRAPQLPDRELVERVRFVHERVGTDAIAEDYIEGREFYVGVIGNRRFDGAERMAIIEYLKTLCPPGLKSVFPGEGAGQAQLCAPLPGGPAQGER